MGKRRIKPLLADAGILHLKKSFVHPSDESGLLSTVGGNQEQPLVLASGTYGYGIPHSVAMKVAQQQHDNEQQLQLDPDHQIVREINGGLYSMSEYSRDRSGAAVLLDDAEMSVGELVRHIGGAGDVPIRRCDVVQDKTIREQQTDENENMEEDPQADEFYASLGIENPNESKSEVGKETGKVETRSEDPGGVPDGQISSQENGNDGKPPENLTASIADFYKSYTQYYYSEIPNPFGDQRLEFGLPIDTDAPQVDSGEQSIIQLARMAQMRARQAKAAADALDKAKKAKALDSGEKTLGEGNTYDPLPMEVVQTDTAEELGITEDSTLEQYWECIRDDPHDFNRWIYLIHYVESKNHITSCRRVYSAFLPLFCYCFGYWKRYSELEKKHNYFGRALTILERGLEFIPLSVDLWLCYIKLFCEIHAHHPEYEFILREQYEKAISACGLEFRSDALWDAYISWETENKQFRRVLNLYARVLQVPTRLYNRHWDNVQAVVRDYHPRDFLEKEEYESLRKKGCRLIGLKYKEEPELRTGEIRKPSKPEDKLMDYTKDKVVNRLTGLHEKCEKETDKRWVYEDRIKRPYFHTKALDRGQLRNWEEYLNFEIEEGSHDRIVLLFERCLISCALYENFWCKYAQYLENYHKKNPNSNQKLSIHFLKIQESMEIGSKKDTEEEEQRITDVKFTLENIITELLVVEKEEKQNVKDCITWLIQNVEAVERRENYEISKVGSSLITEIDLVSETADVNAKMDDEVIIIGVECNASDEVQRKTASPNLSGDSDFSGLPVKDGEQILIDNNDSSSDFSTLVSVPEFPPAKYVWQEAVRDVYKRACIVHCPKKPALRLQWASFEEELGNTAAARDLILHVQAWFPRHFEAKLQLIELERRCGSHESAVKRFDEYLSTAGDKDEYCTLAMKYARFLHKEVQKPDQALKILRNAIKRDKGNPRLYSLVFEICYGRYPQDQRGAFAALELASSCKYLPEEQRLLFLRKKMLYIQEHGDISKYRSAIGQLQKLEEIVRRKETEEMRKKEEEVRLAGSGSNPGLMAFPVPDLSAAHLPTKTPQDPIPIDFESADGTPKPIPVEVEESLVMEETVAFSKVAPPAGLDLSEYGYSSKHPDYKIAEYMAQKEYEQLEAKGYPEEIKDTEGDNPRKRKKPTVDDEGPEYIIKPKSDTMYVSVAPLGAPHAGGAAEENRSNVVELQAPVRMSDMVVPSNSPCVNVPDWFVKEGGELCLSETRAGFSVIRYWPNFLNDIGEKKMFKAVRRSVKWHQKQRVCWERWRYIPRLVSWLGPCVWEDKGLEFKANEDWPPEVLDLLHRINQLTTHEFNSCFMNLYRTGHDHHPWHGDIHPAYGANPPVATISLGSLRLFEMKRRGSTHNFIRFPLFPGSLLMMEGACQVDWSHQIPRDPKVDGERISLVFRIMHAIEKKSALSNEDSKVESSDLKNSKSTLFPLRVDTLCKISTSAAKKPSTTSTAAEIKSNPSAAKNTTNVEPEIEIIAEVNSKKPFDTTEPKPDVEIIKVIEPASKTKIIYHKKVGS